jgi:hypothetical protein
MRSVSVFSVFVALIVMFIIVTGCTSTVGLNGKQQPAQGGLASASPVMGQPLQVTVVAVQTTPAAECRAGMTNCNGYCRDLTSDSQNCGACGITCLSGQSCQKGQCSASCASGLIWCNGVCRNLYMDSANCGSCGVSCGAGASCQNGVCMITTVVTPALSWAGHWTTQTSSTTEMDLVQNADMSVTGSYSGGRGKISGSTYGYPPVLTGTWSWDGGTPAPLVFRMSSDGNSFTGTYRFCRADSGQFLDRSPVKGNTKRLQGEGPVR